ncbi:alpha/beta fold hydrolase [Natrononativus amylolyticus]|uniref:alpha/beta fold hydrolase n=1 Tax=Natrononativus amylolyticus TaxID=2963434 RepID=UPI0020CF5C28|nr:alpha/beta fold hydrolase [Natrononativus amylolyticus]
MAVYRSPAGRRALEEAYAAALETLEIDVDERYVETRHGETHVLLAGPENGAPVVVFHGGNATNPLTLEWYSGLADTRRLIAPDTIGQPGYSAEARVDPAGNGYGEWVVDLLEAFDLRSAPMIGTSYGGGIVLRAAAVAPKRVDRAALVVPAGFGTGPLASMLSVVVPAVLYRVLGSERLLDRTLAAMVTQPTPEPIVRETVAASLRHVSLEREFPSATADELREFTAPVALYVAEDDPFFPPETVAPRARSRLPGLTKEAVLAGEKHLLSPTARETVTASIASFFDE